MAGVDITITRKTEILDAVVRLNVETGRPVSSGLVARWLKGAYSPATIRAVMVRLERDGFLLKPHPSAGRLPTDIGNLAPRSVEGDQQRLRRRDDGHGVTSTGNVVDHETSSSLVQSRPVRISSIVSPPSSTISITPYCPPPG